MVDTLSIIDSALYNTPGFLLVALGVLISIRFAGFPDLTVDGSYTIGAALYALTIKATGAVGPAYLLAMLGGAVAGAMTAGINQFLGIGKIISSVLVMLLLILVVPYLTGGSTIGLLTHQSLIAQIAAIDTNLTRTLLGQVPFSLHILLTTFLFAICAIALSATYYFFKRKPGIEVRYIGSAKNPTLLPKSRRVRAQFIGLMLGNSIIALGGSIEAERAGGFHQNMGLGIILVALAILILGESLLKSRAFRDQLYVGESMAAVAIGAIVYAVGVQVLLALNIAAVDVRLATTLFLLVMLAYASRRHPNSGRLF